MLLHMVARPPGGFLRSILYFSAILPVLAQTPAARPEPEIAQQDAPATFRTRTEMVMVPVVVRDAQGRAVGTLEKPDFQVTDQGRKQTVTRFTVEHSKPLEALVASTPGAVGGTATAPIATRFVLYLFDDVHLAIQDLVRAREAAMKNLEEVLDAGTRVAVMTTTGRTHLDFTNDRDQVRETLLKIQPLISRATQICPALSHYVADRIQNTQDTRAVDSAVEETMQCTEFQLMLLNPSVDPAVVRELAKTEARNAALQVVTIGESDTRLTLGGLKNAILRLSAMPGTRVLVTITPGFVVGTQRREEYDVLDRAIQAGIAINTLDARGLFNPSPSADASQTLANTNDPGTRTALQLEAASAQGDVLAELADGTGGVRFYNNNDLPLGLRRLVSPPETYYMLGFTPNDLKRDGRYRLLKVNLANARGFTVQARHGYFAPMGTVDPEADKREQIEELLFSREELRGLPVDLSLQFFKPTAESATLSVIAKVDVRTMRFRKEDDRSKNTLFVLSGIFDQNGNYIKGIQRTVQMTLRDATLEALRNSGPSVRIGFDLTPGAYVIRVVVWDAEGQTISSRNGVVEIPY